MIGPIKMQLNFNLSEETKNLLPLISHLKFILSSWSSRCRVLIKGRLDLDAVANMESAQAKASVKIVDVPMLALKLVASHSIPGFISSLTCYG